MVRNAKIVATIGPGCKDIDTLRQIIEAGIDVARLNFSHGTYADHAKSIADIRMLSGQLNKPITILQDLQGPKLRVGILPPEGIVLQEGQSVILMAIDEAPGAFDRVVIPMDVPDLTNSLEKGGRILLDDGNLEFLVTAVNKKTIEAKVVLGGKLTSHKGVNLPGAHLNIPGFTDKDREDLIFGLQQGIDVVAISFVSNAQDVELVRDAIHQIDPQKADTPIIAKLERPEAIDNLEQIINCADGVMVARGDLAVETSPASVPIMQKRIIEMANRSNKIVITATQMLDSMIHNPRPTRAEASDVANAIFDGTDAVMLSGETASGSYPIKSVETMRTIIEQAEGSFDQWGHCKNDDGPTQDDAVSLARAARALAHDMNVACIAVFTRTGRTAELVSKARPAVPILAFTPEKRTYQRMGMFWGITPFLVPFANTVEGMISLVETAITTKTLIPSGQQVVMISGYPVGTFQTANLILLHTVGKSI